jgi:deferrochelatase/peroxidase EfeB
MWPSKSLEISKRHRIIRRGRKYCEPAEDSTCGDPGYGDQGICFIALNADLRRQFEFIQQTWLNNPTFNGLDNDKDPIVGDNDGNGDMTMQAEPVDYHVHGLPRFVTVKGGGYFFLPGIRALRFLANYPLGASGAQTATGSPDQAGTTSRPS